MKFATPVPIAANTTYVASYLAPAGHYSDNGPSLEATVTNGPLHAIASGSTGGNGVYAYGAGVTFPKESFNSTNYWVDVLFAPPAPPSVPGAPTGVTATANPGTATVKWTAPTTGGAPTSYTVTPYKAGVAQTPKTITGTPPATETTISGLTAGASYTFTVQAADATGSGAVSAPSSAITIPSGATVPAAPTAVIASPRNGAVAVSWTAPNDGGSPITGYKVTAFEGATELGFGHGLRLEHLDHGRIADQRHHLHLQGGRDQRGRHRRGLRRLELGDATSHPPRTGDAGDGRRQRSGPGRPRRPLQQQRRGQGLRGPLLQGGRQHRPAHRRPLGHQRRRPRLGDGDQRNRIRAGRKSCSPRR